MRLITTPRNVQLYDCRFFFNQEIWEIKVTGNSRLDGNNHSTELKMDDLEKVLEKLQQRKLGETESSELNNLKRLVLTFKTKYKQALQELADKERGQSGNSSEIAKDALDENAALIEQQKSLKELYDKEVQKNKDLLEKLKLTEEVVLSLDQKNRQYESHLGYLHESKTNDEVDQTKKSDNEKKIEELEMEKLKLLKGEKELKEEIWLLKEKLSHSAVKSITENDKQESLRASTIDSSSLECDSDDQEYMLGKIQDQKNRIEQLVKVIQERERRISELQRYEFSFRKVSEINQQYEKEVRAQKQAIQGLKQDRNDLEKKLESAKEHSIQLERAIEHIRGKAEGVQLNAQTLEQEYQIVLSQKQELKGELEDMKQTLVRGLKEAKDIKHYYQNLANEKSAAIRKTAHMQEFIKELTDEIKKRDRERQEFQQQMNDANMKELEFENRLQLEKEKHGEYEKQIKEQDESLASLAEQIKTIQSKFKSAVKASEEKDSNVIEAQKQFAKKVREVSRLTEEAEELKRQISKLQDDVDEAKMRASESHSNLESNLEQMKGLQDKIEVAEKKYFEAHEKIQELEAQNRELKKVEEKHQQMQQLLANLGSVIGSPIGITQPNSLLPSEDKLPASFEDIPKKSQKAKKEKKEEIVFESTVEDQSLFDPIKPSSKFKKDLFD